MPPVASTNAPARTVHRRPVTVATTTCVSARPESVSTSSTAFAPSTTVVHGSRANVSSPTDPNRVGGLYWISVGSTTPSSDSPSTPSPNGPSPHTAWARS